jgi:hypothetical protein
MCLYNSQKANHKINTGKDGLKQTHTHKQRQNKAADNNNNSVSSIASAIMQREKNGYTYIHIAHN